MTFSLALGAGGVVGMAYHAGALHALERHGGISPAAADLVVGTSAGSVVGSLIRCGWSARDLWELAQGTHELLTAVPAEERERRRQAVLRPGWASPVDLVRRAVGSAWVVGRSVVRLPLPDVPALLRRSFPGGMFSAEEARDRLGEILPEAWPQRPLWLCAVDITSGRRVVLGQAGAPRVLLRDAVLASCAIPGVYPPVRAGGMTLVDGGAHSTTNLDLAAEAGSPLIIGVAPMAYETAAPPDALQQLARRRPARSLSREVRDARRREADVLLIRPTAAELAVHGVRLMRPDHPERIAHAAYEATARLLETPRFQRVLGHAQAA